MKKKTPKSARQPKQERYSFHQIPLGSKVVPWAILLLSMAFVAIVRLRLAPMPLERDEGEYAYMGQCILDGIQPYQEAANMKLPGAYYMYAGIMAFFGESPSGIRIGLLLVNLLSIFLLFLLGKRLADAKTGAMAAATFGLMAVVPGTYGFAAHATHFIALFSIAGFLALLKAKDSRPVFYYGLGGFMFGLAFIIKQQAVFLLVFGALLVLMQERSLLPKKSYKSIISKSAVYSVFAVLPFLLVVLTALLTGSFGKFWHWTVEYASKYAGINDWGKGYIMLSETLTLITQGVLGLWLAALAGMVALFFMPASRINRYPILLFSLFSLLCTVPGLYFRNHYFIAFFPALALLAGAAFFFLDELAGRWKPAVAKYLPTAAFLAIVANGIATYRGFYFDYPVPEVCAQLYGKNPFMESLAVADFIKKNTREDERIIVFGSEPQIYFYSGRKAATSYLYTYSLMEDQPYNRVMQEEMKTEIESSKPKYIIFINNNSSWLGNSSSDRYILDWCENFASTNYHPAGLADLISIRETNYVWGKDLNGYKQQGESSIAVMERN